MSGLKRAVVVHDYTYIYDVVKKHGVDVLASFTLNSIDEAYNLRDILEKLEEYPTPRILSKLIGFDIDISEYLLQKPDVIEQIDIRLRQLATIQYGDKILKIEGGYNLKNRIRYLIQVYKDVPFDKKTLDTIISELSTLSTESVEAIMYDMTKEGIIDNMYSTQSYYYLKGALKKNNLLFGLTHPDEADGTNESIEDIKAWYRIMRDNFSEEKSWCMAEYLIQLVDSTTVSSAIVDKLIYGENNEAKQMLSVVMDVYKNYNEPAKGVVRDALKSIVDDLWTYVLEDEANSTSIKSLISAIKLEIK